MGDLGDSLLRMFSSVRLVQEISRSGTASLQSPTTTEPIPISRDATLSLETPPSTPSNTADDQETRSSSFSHSLHNLEPSALQLSSSSQQQQQQQQLTNSYWLPHSVQPIPFSFNNYTPATPSLPFWMSSYNYNKPVRGIRSLLLGRSATSIGATPSSAAPSSTANTTRGHARKHSKHYRRMRASSRAAASVRTKSWRMLDENSEKEKSKSQKLLCLWPLPVVTRYVIAISLMVSALNFVGLIQVSCSAPSYVIHRLALADLVRSPFLFDWSLHGVFIFLWNVLILGLFEESLTHMLGGTRRFLHVLGGIFLTVCALRQGLGYLFSKSTGWAVPVLFFSNSIHECNQGIAPFLFALLTVQSLSIDDKYIMIYGEEDAGHKLTVRKVTLQLLMCLVNYAVKNILWWSLTGLLTGYLAAVIIETCLVRERRSWDEKSLTDRVFVDGYYAQRTPLWRLLWSALKKGAIVLLITLPALLIFNTFYYMRDGLVDPSALNILTQDRYMFTFVVMTAPRRGDPPLLSQTIESYLENWPIDPEPGSLYSRLQMLVYTHFSNHSQYDAAKERFSNDLRGQKYIKWVREDGNEMNQRLHVSKALELAADSFESSYIALVEDDFPVCGSKEWHEIENVIYEANINVPDHCGVFVGTGGSGLFLKPEIAKLVSRLLLDYPDVPPDITIQQCLRGELPECRQCTQSLVTSKTLLMYHIGFNTSTSVNRVYKKDEFQCGWRHPFNGDPAVHTL